MPCNCRRGIGNHDHVNDGMVRDGVFGAGRCLNKAIDLPFIQLWNARNSVAEAENVFDEIHIDNNTPLCSDDDPELLIHIPLKSVCKIRGVCITGPVDDYAPLSVKLFSNPAEICGFDSVRRLQPQEELPLAQVSENDKIIYRLNPIRFASVSNLALYFEHSFNDVETHLLRVELYGEDTGMSTSRKVATNVVYEARANPADHRTKEDKAQFYTVQEREWAQKQK